jgi:TatD DNase family protein
MRVPIPFVFYVPKKRKRAYYIVLLRIGILPKRQWSLGFYISLSGIVSFSSAKDLKEVAKRIPLIRLLIETDSPYLAPVPYRGKKNEPRYLPAVAKAVADIKGIVCEEVATITTRNFSQLFGVSV